MIAPTPFFSDRGCHVRIYEEAKNLASMGNSITICTYHLGKNIPGIDIRRIINIPWYRKTSAGPSLHKIYLDFLLLIKSIVVAYRVKPDIIHAHLNEGALIGKICSLLFGIPLVFDYPVNPEILGDLGSYGQPKDLISFENHIVKLLDDDELRLGIVKKLKALNINQYDWSNSASKVLQAYLSLTENRTALNRPASLK